MTFLRTLLLVSLAGLVGLAAGCGPRSDASRTGAAAGRIKLGFLVKQAEEPWFQYEWKGADRAAAQYGFELLKMGVPDGEKTLAAIDSWRPMVGFCHLHTGCPTGRRSWPRRRRPG